MSRLGTVGICALVLTVFVGMAQADEPDNRVAAAAGPEGMRPIEPANRFDAVANARIRKALDEASEFDFNKLPLSDAVAFIADRHRIDVQLDFRALDDASITADTPVNCRRQDVSLRSALRSMLRQIDLAYVVCDGSLLITTPDRASCELRTKVYPVGDLAAPRHTTLGGEDFKSLIETIRTTIAPTTWDEVGGPASVVPLAQTRSLVVSQTDEVHEQISELLDALRQSRDAQPAAPRVTALGTLVDALAVTLRQHNQRMPAGMGGGMVAAPAVVVPAAANP